MQMVGGVSCVYVEGNHCSIIGNPCLDTGGSVKESSTILRLVTAIDTPVTFWTGDPGLTIYRTHNAYYILCTSMYSKYIHTYTLLPLGGLAA